MRHLIFGGLWFVEDLAQFQKACSRCFRSPESNAHMVHGFWTCPFPKQVLWIFDYRLIIVQIIVLLSVNFWKYCPILENSNKEVQNFQTNLSFHKQIWWRNMLSKINLESKINFLRLSFLGGGHIVFHAFLYLIRHFGPLNTKLNYRYSDCSSYLFPQTSPAPRPGHLPSGGSDTLIGRRRL